MTDALTLADRSSAEYVNLVTKQPHFCVKNGIFAWYFAVLGRFASCVTVQPRNFRVTTNGRFLVCFALGIAFMASV